MAHFSNRLLYTPEMEARARLLMRTEYDLYRENFSADQPNVSKCGNAAEKSKQSVFSAAILSLTVTDTSKSELERYYDPHIYPCTDEDALGWWKAHSMEFPVLSCMARDILAAPGVSVPVERLFSSSRRTITDACCRLTADSASMTICTKEWLKQGLGHNISFLTSRERLV